jgi:peptidoglycan/xylan/chitin deacetylase (PgdA/CDA1 family)
VIPGTIRRACRRLRDPAVRLWKHFFGPALASIPGGALILTFDDDSVADWHETDRVLSPYHWKATFCVSNFEKLGNEERKKLLALQNKGHEIACHSATHLKAVDFVASHSISDYIATDITPAIAAMSEYGLTIYSFVYPHGARNQELDRALLKYFDILRGTVYGMKPIAEHKCFANGSRVVSGLGIDRHYGNELPYLLQVLQFAAANDKIAVFYGHRTHRDDSPELTTGHHTLETICRYAQKYGMRFLTLRELSRDKRH